ncbi:MAG: capsule assembly Wzi family protein [Candidatus Acidiferrales bacterium]
MRVKAMVLMVSLGAMTGGVWPEILWGMPQQNDAKTEASVSTAAATEQSAMTNWTPVPVQSSADDRDSGSLRLNLKTFGVNLATDQKDIWTSPAKIRFSDANWLIPAVVVSGGLFATDHEFSRHLNSGPQTIQRYRDIANGSVGALAGIGGGFVLWSVFSHDEHQRETGFLSAEAAIDSLAVVEALSYATGRQRPYQGDGGGHFFHGGASFPSDHAAVAWSIAGIVAHEYPGTLPKFIVYGLATAVSLSRVQSRDHFTSDVVIGSGIGWLISQHVFAKHHDPGLGGTEWPSLREMTDESKSSGPRNLGSPYVPLDSWVYPALERLAALGYLETDLLGMRPWTRINCASLVEEAGDKNRTMEPFAPEVGDLYAALLKEFQPDLDALDGDGGLSLHLESLYGGATEIAGPSLNDGDHFAQTIINNFGRPYQQGFNSYDGFSGYATAGRFTIYVRGEYQHAPFAPPYSESVRELIASLDANPVQPANPILATNQFRLLDTYAAAHVGGWNISFGKQSLWWGPDEGSDFLFSDNAAPMYMFRVSRIVPIDLPWILHLLGPMKIDAFFGELSGNEFPPRPLLHGEKVSFKPTRNLELGVARTVEFGGVGRPFTLRSLFRSYFVVGYVDNATPANDPGIRTGQFDFSYRVPFLRDWLTVYGEMAYRPVKAGFNGGFYVSHFPHIPKLDFRAEALNSDTYLTNPGEYIYFDGFYHDLYTNHGNLIGSWVGRQGQGEQAWSNYWFTARNRLQANYRHETVSAAFIPGGGTLTDVGIRADWWVRPEIGLSSQVQYEVWNFPVLHPGAQRDITTTLQITFKPPDRWFEKNQHGSKMGEPTAQPPVKEKAGS